MPSLFDDLLDYVERVDIDAVTHAAVSHADRDHPPVRRRERQHQGCVLVARRTGVWVLPPVSTGIAADPGAYLAELTSYRLCGADLQTLGNDWTGRLDHAGVRADAAARRLLPELSSCPVLTSALVAERLGFSERAGWTAITTLASIGIFVGRVQPSIG